MAVRLPGTIGLMLRRFTPEFRYDNGIASGRNRYSIWIYPEDLATQQEIIAIADRRTAVAPLDAVVRTVLRFENVTGGAGTITFILDGPLSQAVIRRSDPGAIVANQWQNIEVICQASLNDCHIYVDGVEVSYALSHSGVPLGGHGGSDVLFGSTYRGLDGGPHYAAGAITVNGLGSASFVTAPGTFFKGRIAHAGLWHEGAHSLLPTGGGVESIAHGFAPTFLNHFLELSSVSKGLLMAPAFYGDGEPLSGYDPEQEHDPVSGIKLEYTDGAGEATWVDGPGICEPCPPDGDGPGPEIPKTPRLCLPFGLPRAEIYSNPGNPADLLPIVYGDFRVGGIRGPVPATLIDKGTNSLGPWIYCAAYHPVLSIDDVYIGDVRQTSGFTVSLSNNVQNKGTIASITFTTQPTDQVSWRGRGALDSTGAALMENAIDQLVHLLTTWGNFDLDEDFDLTAHAQAQAAVETLGYKTAFVIFSEAVTQDWLTEMLFNVMGYWRINGLQQLELHVDVGASYTVADLAASVLASRDCLNGDDGVQFVLDKQHLVNKLTVYYLWNYSSNQASSRLIDIRDDTSLNAYGPMEKAVTLKGLRRAADVAVWAAILLARQSGRTRVEGGLVLFALEGGQFAHLTIGDLIAFTWPYGPTREQNNDYANEVLRILNLTIDPSRGGAMQITAVDLGLYLTSGGARVTTPVSL